VGCQCFKCEKLNFFSGTIRAGFQPPKAAATLPLTEKKAAVDMKSLPGDVFCLGRA